MITVKNTYQYRLFFPRISFRNNFHIEIDIEINEKKYIFKQLKINTKLNDVDKNLLGKVPEGLILLPKGLRSLDLSVNYLGKGTELKKAFRCLPKGLRHLNLNQNWLREQTGKEIQEIFSCLPKDLMVLELNYSNLGDKTGGELKEIFICLPKGLRSLDLGVNSLGDKTIDELKELFSILPKGLKKLDLQNNKLYGKEDEIRQYCKSRGIDVIL